MSYWKSLIMALMVQGAASSIASAECDFGKPHPGAPAELSQYEFLIGDHVIHLRLWNGEAWSEGYSEAYWNGRYGLDGKAILDEWYRADPVAEPDAPRGINVRIYDPEEAVWKLMWMTADKPDPTILRSRVKEDGFMHLWRTHPSEDTRIIHFEVYPEGGENGEAWARYDQYKEDDGSYVMKFKFEAHKVECSP